MSTQQAKIDPNVATFTRLPTAQLEYLKRRNDACSDLLAAAKALWDAMPAPRSEKVTVQWLAMRDAIAKAERV